MSNQPPAKVLNDPAFRWQWIKFQLHAQGKTIVSIAKNAGVSPQTIASCQYKPYPKAEEVIAKEIGFEVAQVFPERYHTDGRRKRFYKRNTH